ncbi:hypothetical protein [Ponticaulis profundi]|uniref:Uncharacterized protein n=1 Tax=Ponticaulis profundi TaxID=2665222 RepID=A0ABW1S5A5_9PROT
MFSILGIEFFAFVGFVFAAYAVVGNDALQTLGTFINSNRRLHWSILFAFAAFILIAVFTYGWITNGGDPSYGKLDNTKKYPVFEVEWYHAIPPLALLILTRFGLPVSTSFLVLSIFASLSGMQSMLIKSGIGYIAAFLTGLIGYALLAPTIERYFLRTKDSQHNPIWVVLQWVTTAYLWSVWLIQDFANIFVFLPRELSVTQSFAAMGVIVLMLAFTFANRGGPVQKILESKTAVTDIRSATIIDFIFATLLFIFSGNLEILGISKVPMSTTWVFLGLIAGREYAIATIDKIRTVGETTKIVAMDGAKALFGLFVSVVLAVGLPMLAQYMGG